MHARGYAVSVMMLETTYTNGGTCVASFELVVVRVTPVRLLSPATPITKFKKNAHRSKVQCKKTLAYDMTCTGG